MPHPDIALILSVRHNTRRCLTTFSVFILMSPQREAHNDAKRKSRSKRGDRTIRYDVFDVVFLLAQGLAEVVQRGLDLIGESPGTVVCCVENAVTRRVR
jgi:hypothetical protein